MKWLHDEGLIPALLTQMNPNVEPEVSKFCFPFLIIYRFKELSQMF